MNSFALLINTFLFIGKIPAAPGTMGSISALIIWWFCHPIPIKVIIIFLILISLLSYYTISVTLKYSNEKDPQYIVIDEVIGMWIALLSLQPDKSNIYYICSAFILFRLLDIFKPSIIYRVQFIPGPIGILLDDIIAGIITYLIIIGIIGINII